MSVVGTLANTTSTLLGLFVGGLVAYGIIKIGKKFLKVEEVVYDG